MNQVIVDLKSVFLDETVAKKKKKNAIFKVLCLYNIQRYRVKC